MTKVRRIAKQNKTRNKQQKKTETNETTQKLQDSDKLAQKYKNIIIKMT